MPHRFLKRKPATEEENSKLLDRRNLFFLIPVLAFSAWEIIAMFVTLPLLRPLATLSDYIQWWGEWAPYHLGDLSIVVVMLTLTLHFLRFF